mmetsp:Transcript_9491/g.14548  ORF Transcript_9491/g.14548 Transcript_9491/m.14548 type:complete len:163 (-) Transcript_9491:141-629(-)
MQSSKADLTLGELQQERLRNQLFIWYSDKKALYKLKEKKDTSATDPGFAFEKVTGRQSINKKNIVKHLRSLRAIGYSLINLLQLSNSQLLISIIAQKYTELALHLRNDVMGTLVESQKAGQSDALTEVGHEALELLLNVLAIKELYKYCDGWKVDLKFLEGL